MQRHTRTHVCREPGCRRKEGFSTKNDLLRHERGVHKLHIVDDRTYVCTHGSCNDQEPRKSWSRADNFRQHLSRVHRVTLEATSGLAVYLRSHVLPPVSLGQELKGIGTAVAGIDTTALPPDIPEPTDILQGQTMQDQVSCKSESTKSSVSSDAGDIEVDAVSQTEGSIRTKPRDEVEPDQARREASQHQTDTPESSKRAGQRNWPSMLENTRHLSTPDEPRKQAVEADNYTSLSDRVAISWDSQSEPTTVSSTDSEIERPPNQVVSYNETVADTPATCGSAIDVNSLLELLRSTAGLPADPASVADHIKRLVPDQEVLLTAVTQILADRRMSSNSLDSVQAKHPHKCGSCYKSFPRPCELK